MGGHVHFAKEYKAWHSMIKRCTDPSNVSYRLYGARGIAVCSRWLDCFSNFLSDMGRAPAGYSLDRINNDGDYTPENCRWATHKQQNNNKSTCVYLTHNGRTQTVTQWAEELQIPRVVLFARIRQNGGKSPKVFMQYRPNKRTLRKCPA